MLPRSAVIVAAARTPIGSFLGGLSSYSATELGTHAIRSALSQSRLEPDEIQLGVGGQVLAAGCGQAPVRQAMLGANVSADPFGVNKVCSSGMKAVTLAAMSIGIGEVETAIAFGMESMSQAPRVLRRTNTPKLGPIVLDDLAVSDGLWDVYNKIHMGTCAEKTCKDFGISRAAQDEYALESYKRAQAAWSDGRMDKEVYPLGGDLTIDEELGNLRLEKVASLKPSFLKEGGTITAANASKLNDGASALVLVSEDFARAQNLQPIAKILAWADFAQAPIDFSTAPKGAIDLALARAKKQIRDIDYFEINEAFSVVPIVNAHLLNIDLGQVNVDGGAVALGHPIGASGNRLVGTLARILEQRDGTLGCAAICNGGGGSTAIVIERM